MRTDTMSMVLLAGALSITPVFARSPYAFDSTPGRLPKSIGRSTIPLKVTPDPAKLTFQGRESIRIKFRSASASIVLDSLNEVLSDVLVDGQPVSKTVTDDTQQLTTISLAQALPAGEHTLAFRYSGKLETQPRGLLSSKIHGYARRGCCIAIDAIGGHRCATYVPMLGRTGVPRHLQSLCDSARRLDCRVRYARTRNAL